MAWWKTESSVGFFNFLFSALAAHRGRGAGGDTAPQGLVRARHEEQRPRPEHRRRQRHPGARALLQGEGVCLRWATEPGEDELHLRPAASSSRPLQGIMALDSPYTGIVDWRLVALRYGKDFEEAGGTVVTESEVNDISMAKESPEGSAEGKRNSPHWRKPVNLI